MGARNPITKPAWAPVVAGIVLLAAALLTAGCETVVTTAQLPAVREDAILGEWKDLGTSNKKPDSNPILIRAADNGYTLGTADDYAKGIETRFTLSRVGGTLLAQSVSQDDCDEFGEKGKPCFLLNRVDLSGGRINWYDLDAQRLGRDSFNGVLQVAHTLHRQRKEDGNTDTAVLLSADAAGLQKFLESYVKQRGVFRLSGKLERIR